MREWMTEWSFFLVDFQQHGLNAGGRKNITTLTYTDEHTHKHTHTAVRSTPRVGSTALKQITSDMTVINNKLWLVVVVVGFFSVWVETPCSCAVLCFPTLSGQNWRRFVSVRFQHLSVPFVLPSFCIFSADQRDTEKHTPSDAPTLKWNVCVFGFCFSSFGLNVNLCCSFLTLKSQRGNAEDSGVLNKGHWVLGSNPFCSHWESHWETTPL